MNISQTLPGKLLLKHGGSLIYVAIAAAALFVASILERSEIERELTELRFRLTDQAGTLKAGIEREAHAHLMIGVAVAAGINHQLEHGGHITQEMFEQIVEPLVENSSDIINVAAAPDLVVRYVYPYAANEFVLGLDYTKNAEQMRDITRVLETGRLLYSGPFNLVQGGTGFIQRVPVLTGTQLGTEPRFWGLVSIVVDQQALFEAAGFDDLASNLLVAVRIGGDPAPVWGDAGVLDNDPAEAVFMVDGQKWTIAMVPRGGWAIESNKIAPIWELTGVATVALLILVYLYRLSRNQNAATTRRLEASIRTLDGGFVIYDAEDRLVICNETYRRYHGLAAYAVVPGATFEDIIRAAAAQGEITSAVGREDDWIAERLRSHRELEDGVEVQLTNGHWYRSTENRMPDGGTVNFWSDVTALRRAKDQAELASRAKTDFLNTISHELRTPLTGILGFSAFLRQLHRLPSYKKLIQASASAATEPHALDAAIEAFSSEVGNYARRIDDAGQSLSTLVNDLLDWSKLEAAAISIDPVPVDLGQLIEETVKRFEPIAKSKGLELRHSGDGEGVIAMGDRSRISQVLVKIIGNALKFTESGSIDVWAEDTGGSVKVLVRDTGRGIAEENLKSIFENFKQVDSSITRAYSGTGLGLAISRRIVEMHGGTIGVESAEGEGSTFMFTLPRKSSDAASGTNVRLAG